MGQEGDREGEDRSSPDHILRSCVAMRGSSSSHFSGVKERLKKLSSFLVMTGLLGIIFKMTP